MKIYTKNGDRGKTTLLNERVSKANPRIEINGQIDELLVMLAMLIEGVKKLDNENLTLQLKEVYRDLFKLAAVIADVNNQLQLNLVDGDVTKLELAIDDMTKALPELRNFIYYMGSDTAMQCQAVRAKVRQVERLVVALYEHGPVDNLILIYLNRLSDYFYTLGRFLNKLTGHEEEVLKL